MPALTRLLPPQACLRHAGLFIAMLFPLGLLHAWVLAEFAAAFVDVLFLVESFRRRDFAWARRPWFIVAVIWWLWVTACSTPAPQLGLVVDGWQMGFAEAFVIIRLILFAAALEAWLLTTARARRLAWLMLALSVLWIGVESWQEYLTGSNLFGDHRWGDGSLTGPFYKPRAGDLYAHLLFIAVLPPMMALFARRGRIWTISGAALAVIGVVTSVLIGQRMGTIFTGLGLLTAAAFIPKFRKPALLAAAIAVAVLLLTPLISPATHAKLVGETSQNLGHFALSPYGELYTRATVMGLASPLHGWGYNGFRAFCPLPMFTKGIPALGLAPTSLQLAACNLHPHNFYLQAFADAGFPGLALFCLMMATWLATLARGLFRAADPLRIGVFACVVTFAWPLASTDEFPALYMSGWLFFALGLGLALTHMPPDPTLPDAKNA
jgi:O-antigen ligase